MKTSRGKQNLTAALAPYRQSEYASGDDFCMIFSENMDGLYSLALWLTASHSLAEQVFAAALEDCRNANGIFKEWAHSWSRLAIIESAIRVVKPLPSDSFGGVLAGGKSIPEGIHPEAGWLMKLMPFDRFVYVLAVLNRYSSRDCAIRLRCTFQDVEAARGRALQIVPAGSNQMLTSSSAVSSEVALRAQDNFFRSKREIWQSESF